MILREISLIIEELIPIYKEIICGEYSISLAGSHAKGKADIHSIVQVLFALNEKYFHGDKKIELQLNELEFCPKELVLNIGFGTGANVECYPKYIKSITAIDTFTREFESTKLKVELYNMSVEDMEFEDSSFDTVVSTFTFCSINDLDKALSEIKRVLKPKGRLIYLEHGKSQNRAAAFLQNMVNPLFNIFACGCNVNRDFEKIIEANGFVLEKNIKRCIHIYPKVIAGQVYMGLARKGCSNEI